MKHLLTKFLFIFTATLSIHTVWAAPETYVLDPGHSYVQFYINHFNFSRPSGKWYAKGTLVLDKEKPQNDKVDVTINVNDMVTGIPDLDKHLKSEEFFHTTQFPTATFVSDKVVMTGTDTADIHGTLTVHGVSKPLVLKAKLNRADISPISKKMTAGFSATASLKRSDFGMGAFAPGLSDEVDLVIEIEAVKK